MSFKQKILEHFFINKIYIIVNICLRNSFTKICTSKKKGWKKTLVAILVTYSKLKDL